jgi:UDP-N-acetyl-D-mannosaminuronate dehydrogenase
MYEIAIVRQDDVGLPLTVAHQEFLMLNFEEFQKNNAAVFATKSIINRKFVDAR